MRKTLELAIKCNVSENTVRRVAQRIYEINECNVLRYPTEYEINNRQQFYKKKGRPTKYKE